LEENRDLLLRHRATHAKNAAEGQVHRNRALERATKACNDCVISKVKCENSRPCQRCQKKGFECTTITLSRSEGSALFDPQGQSIAELTPPSEQRLSHVSPQGEVEPSPIISRELQEVFNDVATDDHEQAGLYQDVNNSQLGVSNFFEQIMVMEPDFMGMDYLQPPPDLTSWFPEIDWFGQNNIFESDFAPAIDETFQTTHIDMESVGPMTTPQGTIINLGRENNSSEAVKRRHAVFKQSSPWFYVPERDQNAFSNNENMILDERQVDLAASPHQPYSSDVVIPDRLSQQSRDRIFQLVLTTAQNRISIPIFPSADCLDKLIKVGIAKKTESSAWIHPYTFKSESSLPEFLTALVVAGCICFGIPSVNKTGLILHEIVRISLRELSERDNSVLQEIQYLQASMLWLDIGAFCGYKHKMQTAEGSLQALITALRRAGRFDGVRYPIIIPTMEDSEELLNKKWQQWIQFESYKRLVYHILEHDIYMAMINHRQPLISYAEITAPTPASKLLWLAPSAEVWRARMLGIPTPDTRPSLRSMLQDDGSTICLIPSIDTESARSAYLHGIGAQIWEYVQQNTLLQDHSDPSTQLWSRSRQQKLFQSLQVADFSLHNAQAITCVFYYFLQMFLHVDLDAVTRFAGRCGEEAAHKAYIVLLTWSRTKEARVAIRTLFSVTPLSCTSLFLHNTLPILTCYLS
jgi:hypothetical protein